MIATQRLYSNQWLRYGAFSLLVVAVLLALTLRVVGAFEFGGGYLSVRVVERQGTVGNTLVVGRSGVSNSYLEVGRGATVASTPATNVSPNSITLNGTLSSLSGMPQATVYFQWGYDTSYGNTTAGQVMASTGAFSATITDFDSTLPIYYRAVADTDGTAFGDARYVQTGRSIAWAMLSVILRIVLAAVVLIGAIMLAKGNPLQLLINVVIGIVAFVIVSTLIDTVLGMG